MSGANGKLNWWQKVCVVLVIALAAVPMLLMLVLLLPFAVVAHEHSPDRERIARMRGEHVPPAVPRTIKPRLGRKPATHIRPLMPRTNPYRN